MTTNQIAYQRLLEEKRSNMANEALSQGRNDIAVESNKIAMKQAQTAAKQADTQRAKTTADIVMGGVKYILPTADTALSSAASFFGG